MPSINECYESVKDDIAQYNGAMAGESLLDCFCSLWKRHGCNYHRACIFNSIEIRKFGPQFKAQGCPYSDRSVVAGLIRIDSMQIEEYTTKW
jgi:hypothetical protein